MTMLRYGSVTAAPSAARSTTCNAGYRTGSLVYLSAVEHACKPSADGRFAFAGMTDSGRKKGALADSGLRIRRLSTEFGAAVRQRNRDRSDSDFGDADVLRNPNPLCSGRREIHDPALHVRSAVLDSNYRALTTINV